MPGSLPCASARLCASGACQASRRHRSRGVSRRRLGPQLDHLPAAARRPRHAALARGAHHDPGPLGAEQVVRILDRLVLAVDGRSRDRQQRGTRPQRRGSPPRRGTRRPPRCARPPPWAGCRSAPRAARRPTRRGAAPAARGTGRPEASACSTEIGLPSASLIRTRSMTSAPGRSRSALAAVSSPGPAARTDPRPRHDPWLRSIAGTPDDPRQVALDLGLADEGAAAPAGHPADQPALFEHGERLAKRGAADAELGGQLALGAEALARPQIARRRSDPPGSGARPHACALGSVISRPGRRATRAAPGRRPRRWSAR